jgi:hypothetical protein
MTVTHFLRPVDYRRWKFPSGLFPLLQRADVDYIDDRATPRVDAVPDSRSDPVERAIQKTWGRYGLETNDETPFSPK